jgi:hypothetical protein
MNHSKLPLTIALISLCLGNGASLQGSESSEASATPKAISLPSIHDSQFKISGSSYRVGMITRNFTDEKRKNWQATGPRPLRTAIWYPAAAASGEPETIFGGPSETQLFTAVTVADGAELSPASNKYPLVLLSHGTGGSAVMMMWLGYYLAERGYIVAAVNHQAIRRQRSSPRRKGFCFIGNALETYQPCSISCLQIRFLVHELTLPGLAPPVFRWEAIP